MFPVKSVPCTVGEGWKRWKGNRSPASGVNAALGAGDLVLRTQENQLLCFMACLGSFANSVARVEGL